jgi:hypothetical protein
MQDLAAAGRAADKSIQRPAPSPGPAGSAVEALRPAEAVPGWTPMPELEGKPRIVLGTWNEVA